MARSTVRAPRFLHVFLLVVLTIASCAFVRPSTILESFHLNETHALQFVAVGYQAKQNYVSHVQLEPSSLIVSPAFNIIRCYISTCSVTL
jgi:uncharacterized membrane protein